MNILICGCCLYSSYVHHLNSSSFSRRLNGTLVQVKPNHTYVNANGLVNIPYTQRWVPTCTLRDLVIALISIFNNEPPLFSKPPVVDEPIPSWVLDDSRASAALSGSLSARNNISNRSVNNGNNNHFNNMDNPNSNSSIENSSSSGGKAELIEQVTLKMQAYMHQRLSKICEEIDTELWTQQRLNERIQKIEQIQRDLRAQTGKFKESRERVHILVLIFIWLFDCIANFIMNPNRYLLRLSN